MRAKLAILALLLGVVLSPTAQAEERVALVIGNSAYKNAPPLRNPKNDAELMSRALKGVAFEVTTLIDADQITMKRAMVEFGRKLRSSDSVGLFYYAGHGVQVDGENYLIPVNAAIQDEAEVPVEGVSVNDFLGAMERAASRMNIAIFDACRNNPFGRSFRSASRGLATVDAPAGTIIAYATAPGQVALDGTGENSPYTASLVAALATPGITIEEVFKRARREVLKRTEKKQTPWETSSLVGDFFFKPEGGVPSIASAPSSPAATTPKTAALPSPATVPPAPQPGGGGAQAVALFERGLALDTGQNVVENKEEAARLYRQAADLGHVGAMHNLAMLLDNGRGVERDDVQAAQWYRKAAEKGDAASMVVLGTMHEFGEGVPKDLEAAFQWYRLAAESGSPQGMMELAHMYGVGKGIEHNPGEARRWFLSAAEKGVARAMFELGSLAEEGSGGTRNFGEAAGWYAKAAEQDYAAAKHRLAVLYDKGLGVPRNAGTAADFLLQSFRHGYRAARDDLMVGSDNWSLDTRREIQQRLKDAGQYKGTIDGNFGSTTKRALTAYGRQ